VYLIIVYCTVYHKLQNRKQDFFYNLFNIKEFRYQFEMILEGARQLDVARSTLLGAEQKETRIKKELKKAAKKATAEEIREMSGR